MRVLVVILASSLCWGCFVLDEIDAGQKEMNRYDGKGAAKEGGEAPAAAKADAAEPQGAHAEVVGWRAGPSRRAPTMRRATS